MMKNYNQTYFEDIVLTPWNDDINDGDITNDLVYPN